MSNIEQALKAALAAIDLYDYTGTQSESELYAKAERLCKSALSEIGECEPVAEALHERNRLGYAVVDVIGTLDEIIENAQEVEVDDFLHIAIPIDKWHELQDALEEMPKRAELYTSPLQSQTVKEALEKAVSICDALREEAVIKYLKNNKAQYEGSIDALDIASARIYQLIEKEG